MINLRPHQVDLLARARMALTEHRSILIYAPPGAGKTYLAAAMACGAIAKGKRVIFCCHRREIMAQTAITFDRFDIDYGYIAAGIAPSPNAMAHVASIDTLRNRYDQWPADLIVIDEAHLSGAATWTNVIDWYRSRGAFVVGLSGSPFRLDGRPLRSNFAHMVQGPQNRWLMDKGLLSEYRAFAPARMDLTGIRSRGGDYAVDDLEAKFDKPSIIGDAVSSWVKFAGGKRTVVYAFSINHSKSIVDVFRSAGVTAAHIDGLTPNDDRRDIIRKFADGEIKVLSSVDLLTAGFDLSAQVGRDVPIEAVSLLRPTKSLALAIQMMGRALRPKPYPAVILDHAGILRDHGLPCQDREWSLDGAGSAKKAGEAVIPTCVCHSCFAIFRPAYQCPYCLAVREIDGRKIKIEDGELSEIDIRSIRDAAIAAEQDAARRQDRRAEGMARTVADLAAIAKARGYKPGWVAARLKSRGERVDFNDIMRAMR